VVEEAREEEEGGEAKGLPPATQQSSPPQ